MDGLGREKEEGGEERRATNRSDEILGSDEIEDSMRGHFHDEDDVSVEHVGLMGV